jgi:hypothetical protein
LVEQLEDRWVLSTLGVGPGADLSLLTTTRGTTPVQAAPLPAASGEGGRGGLALTSSTTPADSNGPDDLTLPSSARGAGGRGKSDSGLTSNIFGPDTSAPDGLSVTSTTPGKSDKASVSGKDNSDDNDQGDLTLTSTTPGKGGSALSSDTTRRAESHAPADLTLTLTPSSSRSQAPPVVTSNVARSVGRSAAVITINTWFVEAPSAATDIAAPTEIATTVATDSAAVETAATPAPAPESAAAAPRALRPAVPVSAPTAADPAPVAAAVAPVNVPGRGSDGSTAGPGERPVAAPASARAVPAAVDPLPGGTAPAPLSPALPHRAADGGGREIPGPSPWSREVARVTDAQPGGTAARGGPTGAAAAELPAETDAPLAADLLTDVPASALQGLGLGTRQLTGRVHDLLGELAGDLAFWQVAAAGTVVLAGGTAYGLVRRRRSRRGRQAGPPVPDKDTDTWLPAPADAP